jgi:hypothetical protein
MVMLVHAKLKQTWEEFRGDSNLCDALPSSLMDSNVSLNWNNEKANSQSMLPGS